MRWQKGVCVESRGADAGGLTIDAGLSGIDAGGLTTDAGLSGIDAGTLRMRIF